MRSRKSLVALSVLVFLSALCLEVAGQKSVPKPTATPLPKIQIIDGIPATETEEDFQSELVRIKLEEDENWRTFTLSEFNFKASFPRTPVRNTEYFEDEVFGRTRLTIFLALAEHVGYGVGHHRLAYAVTDPAARKAIYEVNAREFLGDPGFSLKKTVEVEVKGVTGMKIVGATDGGTTPFVAHIFIIGRDLFFTFVTDSSAAASEEPAAGFDALAASFLKGFEHLPEVKAPMMPVPDEYLSKFADSVFRSEFFRFTLKVPAEWHLLPIEAVQDMRVVTADVIRRNSEIKVPERIARRNNLFTFTLKPLGMERNSSLVCNILKSPAKWATARGLALEMNRTLKQTRLYTKISEPVSERIGGVAFVRVDTEGEMAGVAYSQQIYYVIRNGYGLIFALSFFDEEAKDGITDVFRTISFETP